MKKKNNIAKRVLAVCVAMGLFSVNAFGAVPAKTPVEKTEIMTYDKALALATKNNTELVDLVEKIDDLQEDRSDMFTNIGGTGARPGNPDQLMIMDSSRLANLVAVRGLNTSVETSRLEQELTKQGIEASLKSTLGDIKLEKEDLAIMEDTLAQEKQSLAYARVKASLGMISADELKKLEGTTLQKEQTKVQAVYHLEKKYMNFNNLLGLPSETRYDIEYEVEITPVILDAKTLDNHIDRALGQDISLKIAKLQMDNNELSYLTISSETTMAQYRQTEATLEQSQRAYKNAVKDKKNAMRSAYIQLQEMESTQKSLEADFAKAENDYKQAQVNHQIGNIAKLTLDQAETTLQQAKLNVEKNEYQYDVLKYNFEHPSLVSGAGGAVS